MSKCNEKFNKFKDSCNSSKTRGFKHFLKWPILGFIGPCKLSILILILITLLISGVGLYGIVILILLTLLFFFIP